MYVQIQPIAVPLGDMRVHPAQSLVASRLQTGETLKAVVVSRGDGGLVTLQVNDAIVRAQTAVSLLPGEVLNLQVRQGGTANSMPVLQIVSRTPQDPVSVALRRDLPLRVDLSQALAALSQGIRAPQALPKAVQGGIAHLLSLARPLEALARPQELKRAVQESGIFLESKLLADDPGATRDMKAALLRLAQALSRSEGSSSPPLANTPENTQGAGRNAPAVPPSQAEPSRAQASGPDGEAQQAVLASSPPHAEGKPQASPMSVPAQEEAYALFRPMPAESLPGGEDAPVKTSGATPSAPQSPSEHPLALDASSGKQDAAPLFPVDQGTPSASDASAGKGQSPPAPLRDVHLTSKHPSSPAPAEENDGGHIAHLRQMAEGALADMRLRQLASLPQEGGEQFFLVVLPVLLGAQTEAMPFRIHLPEESEERDARQENRSWSVSLALELGDLGKFTALVWQSQGRVFVDLWSEEERARRWMDAHLGDLAQAMREVGLSVGKMTLQPLPPSATEEIFPRTPLFLVNRRV